MQTARDAEVVRWIAQIGAAGACHVQARFGMCQSRAYARLGALTRDGLLAHVQLLHRRAGLYVASREGLRWVGLERLPVQCISPGGFQHAWELAGAGVALCGAAPAWRQLSERELRLFEREQGKPIASIVLGELPGGRPALHRPDLALLDGAGHVLAIEVELTVKAPRRLRQIARAYARARHVASVYYLASPPAARAVNRAVVEVRATDRITVLSLHDAGALAASLRTEMPSGAR